MIFSPLQKRSDFLRVAQAKIMVKTPTIIIQCRQYRIDSEQSNQVRVGFTASKKVGNAVIRNRSKRRMRALVENYLEQIILPFLSYSYDFVFIAVIKTAHLNFQLLQNDFCKAVKLCLEKCISQNSTFIREEVAL